MPVPRDADVVDAKGKVLSPGFVDVHCHINQPPEDMKRYWIAQLRWGVTTMRSAGNDKPETVPLFRQTIQGVAASVARPGVDSRATANRPVACSRGA